MATGSFKKSVVIKDKRDAKAFIDALEAVVFKRENANKTKKKQKKRYKVR